MKHTFYFLVFFLVFSSCDATSKKVSSGITHVPSSEESAASQVDKSKEVDLNGATRVGVITSAEELAKKNAPVEEKKVITPKVKPRSKPTAKPKPKVTKKFPVITFDSLVHRLPDITEGDVIHHDMHFTNTGEAPLSIMFVKPSCGCTQPSFPFLDIAPGEKGVIGVDYHSVGKDGPQRPELKVEANTYPKHTIVALEVNVVPKPEAQDTLSN